MGQSPSSLSFLFFLVQQDTWPPLLSLSLCLALLHRDTLEPALDCASPTRLGPTLPPVRARVACAHPAYAGLVIRASMPSLAINSQVAHVTRFVSLRRPETLVSPSILPTSSPSPAALSPHRSPSPVGFLLFRSRHLTFPTSLSPSPTSVWPIHHLGVLPPPPSSHRRLPLPPPPQFLSDHSEGTRRSP